MTQPLVLNHEMNDIIFEGRNKSYGAYVLRHEYEGNMARAMLAGLLFFLLFVTSSFAYYYFKGQAIPDIIFTNTPVNLDQFTPKPVLKQPVTPVNSPPQKLKPQIKFVPPVVVPDEEETPEDLPPGIDELKNNNIGSQTQINANGTIDADLGVENPGTGIVDEPSPEPTVYNSYAVEQQPEFPDGLDAMYTFLKKNIGYPQLAKEIGLSGIVYVQFVVSKEGRIEHAKIVRGVGGGLDQEALRVVNLMPAWKPGRHNGKPVAVNFTLPIKFQLLK
ncbi:MAG: energy transducer TonB [Saprospiraceae bacterium]|nr:energy transducer TonB [Saprospiraceae bacterium]